MSVAAAAATAVVGGVVSNMMAPDAPNPGGSGPGGQGQYIPPELLDLYKEAQAWHQSGQGYQYYPESTVAGQAPETQAANYLTTQRALSGNPLLQQSQQYASDVLGGKYLQNNNPYLADMVAAATRAQAENYKNVMAPAIASQFSAFGRYGSGAQSDALIKGGNQLAQALQDTATNLYGTNYENERQRQQSMSQPGMATALGSADYTDLEKLLGVGTARNANEQAIINANKLRWDTQQQAPLKSMTDYAGLLTGNGLKPVAPTPPTATGVSPYAPLAMEVAKKVDWNNLFGSGNNGQATSLMGQ